MSTYNKLYVNFLSSSQLLFNSLMQLSVRDWIVEQLAVLLEFMTLCDVA